MSDIIYTIITLFKNSEECRRNKQRAEYKKIYWEMERLYINNMEKLREIESLRNYWNNVWQNFEKNMDYIPPALKSENYPIQYRDRIMDATQISSASMSSGLLANHTPLPNSSGYELKENGYPSTVHVPQLPPIQQYYSIPTTVNNTDLLSNLNNTYSAMDAQHHRFESNFRNDMNRMGGF